MVPKAKLADRPIKSYQPAQKHKKYKKKKKRGLFSKVLDEAWDVIEDVFD
jgi:hypothetical protein